MFSATEVVGELSMDLHSGEPSNVSSCVDIDVPWSLTAGQALVLSGSVSSGITNALAYDPDEDTVVLTLSECDLHSLNSSYDTNTSMSDGMYEMTVIDWTDDPRCSGLLEEHNFVVFKPLGQLSVHFAINQSINIAPRHNVSNAL